MSEKILFKPLGRKRKIELSQEERATLNAVIDLIIPSDDYFPPPSSLPLIDELLRHLVPDVANHISLILNEGRLRHALHEINIAADGNFCKLSPERQKQILSSFEQHDPVCFQTLTTLVNHSYYSHLAIHRPISTSQSYFGSSR
jgi:D-ribose pyranose/furanose isomerase RbsD